MANFVQVIQRIVNDSIQKLRRLRLDEIEGDGGARLHSRNKKWYYNGTEIGSGSAGEPCVFEQSGTYIAPKSPGCVHADGFQTSNSNEIQVGAYYNCIRMDHNGGDGDRGIHSVRATHGLDLVSVNGGVRIVGHSLSASVNGDTGFYNVLTTNVTSDVNFNDNASILNLNSIRFGTLGYSTFYKGSTPMMFFEENAGAYFNSFNYPLNVFRNKIYLNKENTDAASAFIFNNGANGNTIHNVAATDSHVFQTNAVQLVSISSAALDVDVPFDLTGQKIYLYRQSTDAASMYITRNTTTGNMVIHLPAGKSVEWTVG